MVNNKVFLKDYDIEQNEHFVKYVFIPYFKDIFKDLAERSDKKAKGINHIAFIEVINSSSIYPYLYLQSFHIILIQCVVCEFARNIERKIL
jgi:hypothetical protein